jgi:hypothetical protein
MKKLSLTMIAISKATDNAMQQQNTLNILIKVIMNGIISLDYLMGQKEKMP